AADEEELQRLIADQANDDAGGGTRGDGESTDALDHADSLDSETEPVPDEQGRIRELESQDPRPTGEERMMRGNDFNDAQKGVYDYSEVTLENGKRVDGWSPGREIVSRKETQLAELSEKQAENYFNEFLDKYGPGNRVADTPKARAEYPHLIGQPLDGNLILEVPIQKAPPPDWFGELARRWNITVRDPAGTIYN